MNKILFILISILFLGQMIQAQEYELISEYEDPDGGFQFVNFYVNGEYLYGFNNGSNDYMGIYDISDVTNITKVAQVDLPDRILGSAQFTVLNGYMYVSDDHLYVFDISNSSNPVLVNSIDVGLDGVQYKPGYITNNGVSLFVSNPSGPFAGSLAKLTLDNPSFPQMQSYVRDGLLGFFSANDIELISDSEAIFWESSADGFSRINITGSIPESPPLTGDANFTHLEDRFVRNFEIYSENILVGVLTKGFFDDPHVFAYDLSNKQFLSEVPIKDYSTVFNNYTVDINNEILWAADANESYTLDISDLSNIVVLDTISTAGREVYFHNGNIYAGYFNKIKVYSAGASQSNVSANFSISTVNINVGQSIEFSDTSTGNPTSWSWTFEGGSPSSSTDQNPTVTYNTEGTYDVSLIASNGSSTDTEIKNEYITVTSTTDCENVTQAHLGVNIASSAPSWFSYTADIDQILTISTADSQVDTDLYVYDVCGGTSLAENDDIDFDTGIYQSELNIFLNSGQTILIEWLATWEATGFEFVLSQQLAEPILEADSLVLVALYNVTNGAGWSDDANWLVKPVIFWNGVRLNDNRVVSIDLENNALVGTLPMELGDLTAVQTLNLGQNQLSGTIPTELMNLTSLDYLDLDGNQLTGEIPSAIGNLVNLTRLDLDENQLVGTIPSSIGNLSNLEVINLWENQLTGEIPLEFANLTKLVHLGLDNNSFTGIIPSEIGDLSKLQTISLGGNNFQGNIPTELGSLSDLVFLYLWGNNLIGEIPVQLGNLTNLTSLELQGNQLTGNIPPELGNLKNLQVHRLENNQLSGTVPLELINTQVKTFFLNNNEGLCESMGAGYQNWVASIESYMGTGSLCDASDDTAPEFTSSTNVTIEEDNGEVFYIAISNEPVNYSLNKDNDGVLFQLNVDALSFISAPDFENPKDENEDNVYSIEIYATDAGGNTSILELAVIVTDITVDQTISFNPLSIMTFDDEVFELSATASSGLVVEFSSSDESIAVVSGTTATIMGAGTTTIIAGQLGNHDYNPALDVEQELIVNKADQEITIDDIQSDLTSLDGNVLINPDYSSGKKEATI